MVEAKFNLLPDPCNDRPVKSVEPPPNRPIDQKLLFPSTGTHLFHHFFVLFIQSSELVII